jgi:hypothetical protein
MAEIAEDNAMIGTVTVDTRVFDRRMLRLSADLQKKVRMKALNDAAVQTRNRAQRDIGKTLNLPAKKIKEKLPVKRASFRAGELYSSVLGQYAPVGIQSFIGWRYVGKQRGRNLTMTAKRTMFESRGKAGLFVKQHKGQPTMRFKMAFPLRAGSFFQRDLPSTSKSPKGWSKNMPIQRIVGASPWAEFAEWIRRNRRIPREIYLRRLEYWIGESITKQYGS